MGGWAGARVGCSECPAWPQSPPPTPAGWRGLQDVALSSPPTRDSLAFALLGSSLDAAPAACQLQLKRAGNRLGKRLE